MYKNFTYYHLIFGTLLLGMGIYLLVSPPENPVFESVPPMFMSGAFIAYGLFRIWRGIVGLRRLNKEETRDSELEERRRKLFPEQDEDENV